MARRSAGGVIGIRAEEDLREESREQKTNPLFSPPACASLWSDRKKAEPTLSGGLLGSGQLFEVKRSAFLTGDKTKVPLLTCLAFSKLYRLTNNYEQIYH
jgi:hypothetical protein